MLYRIAVTLAALSGVQALRVVEDEETPTLAVLEPNNDYKDNEFKSLSGNEIPVSDVTFVYKNSSTLSIKMATFAAKKSDAFLLNI